VANGYPKSLLFNERCLYACCGRFVNVHNLQNALRNFEMEYAQFANFRHKSDHKHKFTQPQQH